MLAADADVLAYQMRAAQVLDANVASIRAWARANSAVPENAPTGGISIWTVAAAYTRASTDTTLLSVAEKAAASLLARRATSLFVGGNDGWEAWATADTYLRHRARIDAATGRYAPTGLAANPASVDGRYTLAELFRHVLTKSAYAPIDSTSNHVLMNATARYLAEQAFPGQVEKGYNGSTTDPTGAGVIRRRAEQLVTGGPAEYLSLNYGAYNWAEFLSVHQLTALPAHADLAQRAKIAFEAAFAMNAAYWMNGQLAGPVGRGYPNTGGWGASGGDSLTWTFLGGDYGQSAQQLAYASSTDVKTLGVLASVSQFGSGGVASYSIPVSLLKLDDPVPKVTRSNFGTNHQYAYNTGRWSTYSESYKWDAYGPYQATWRSRTMWTKPESQDYEAVAWATNPATSLTANANGSWSYVDPYTLQAWQLSGSGTYSGSSVFSDMMQNLNTVLQVYNIPPLAIAARPGGTLPVRGTLIYVPVPKVIATGADAADGDGWFRPVISGDAKRLFVAYEGVFMCFLSTAPISLGTRVGQKQFYNIYGGTEPGQQAAADSYLQYAVAQETFSPEQFAGSTLAERFANFQTVMNTRRLPELVKADTYHPAWRYADDKATLTSEFGGLARYATDPQGITEAFGQDSIGGLGNVEPKIVDYAAWPFLEQADVGGAVWLNQPQDGALTVTVPGQTPLAYDFINWRALAGSDIGLRASSPGGGQIRLDWRAGLGASGFTVERSADGLAWTTLTTSLPGTATGYVDSGRPQKTAWLYRVTPRGTSLGASLPTWTTASFAAPSDLALRLNAANQIALTWTNNAAGNSSVQLQYSLDGSTQWRWLVNLPASYKNRTVTYTDFVGAERVFFRARAYATTGPNGTTVYSAASNVVGTEFAGAYVGGTISMPRFLTARWAAARVALTWDDTATNETGYEVERSADGGATWQVVASGLPANTVTYVDGTVAAGAAYAYRVAARTATSRSAPSAPVGVVAKAVNAAPVIAREATALEAVVAGDSTTVSVLGADDDGEAGLRYAWTAVAGPGVVTFAAPPGNAAKSTRVAFSRAGTYRLRVTVSDTAGLATDSEVSVTVQQTPTRITLTPTSRTIGSGDSLRCAAAVLDQFGSPLAVQPAVTWTSTAGAIDAAGLFTAPAGPGLAVVAAAAAGLMGTTTIGYTTRPRPLVAYAFEEASGGLAADASGNGFDAALSGGVAFGAGAPVPGAGSGGLVFSGTGVALIGDPPALQFTGAITLSAWIKPTGTTGIQSIVEKGYNTGAAAGEIFLRINAGAYQVGSYDGATAMASATISAGDVGQWVHLLGTYDTAQQKWVLYRNGVQAAASGTTSKGAVPVTGRGWTIGATAIGNRFFTGSIDEVRITAASTTAAEARAAYDAFLGPTIATPAAAASPRLGVAMLTVQGQSPAGEAALRYTWAPVGPVPAPVTFPGNGTNAAKSMAAVFAAPGLYRFVVAVGDAAGGTALSATTLVVGSLDDYVVDVPGGTVATLPAPLVGRARLVKRGAGTLLLDRASAHGGGSLVEGGSLVVGHAEGLGTGGLEIGGSGAVSLAIGYGTAALKSLVIEAGGRLDLGTGRVTVAAGGFAESAVQGWLLSGRNGGAWNGATGIMSRAAPLGSRRAVGNRTSGGILTLAWAAFGDVNLDGRVNSIDVTLLSTSGRFNAPGATSRWDQGDFNYDGRVNSIDVALLSSSGLFNQPSYRTGPGTTD